MEMSEKIHLPTITQVMQFLLIPCCLSPAALDCTACFFPIS
jgi:hypothetical protein